MDYFQKGNRVRLCHLKAAKYNLLYGTLLMNFSSGMERLGVQVELKDGTTKDLSLKVENLAPCAKNPVREGEDAGA